MLRRKRNLECLPKRHREKSTLRDEIRRHEELYYLDRILRFLISEYDALLEKLRKLEEQHPELITS